MTIEEARERLEKALGHPLPPRPEPSQRHKDRVATLRAEHDQTMRDLKARADEQIAKDTQTQEERLVEGRLRRQLLREQSMESQRQRDRVELSSRRGWRRFYDELGISLDDTQRRELEDELCGAVDATSNPLVQRLSTWLQDVWRHEHIDVRDCRDPQIANGGACRTNRSIDIALPIRNLRIALIALHETGHIVHPDGESREVLSEDKFHKVNVPHEIAAWRWVLDHTPVWTEPMHADMTRFLGSYKHYAIESEIVAIDELCSKMSFRITKSRIAKEC